MDALLISLYMMAWMAGAALLMAGITAAVTAVTQKTAQTLFRKRFIELSYQLIPVAMISLLTGLGSNLFAILGHELGKQPIRVIKIMLLLLSCVWGVRLCHSILLAQGVAKRRLALFIAAIGNLAVALCWWPAIAM